MDKSPFIDRLAAAVAERQTPLLVGLDPRWANLPREFRTEPASMAEQAAAYEGFCCGVIDVVAPLVSAVKPQAAFFEELGPAGMVALADVIAYARNQGLLVILDGKRNDIGSTAEAYARGWLGRDKSPWGADALTVSPYLGDDSLTPFVATARERDAGIFVLVKTSNPGGAVWQDLDAGGGRLHQLVGSHVEQLATQTLGACGYGAVGAVVGATYPEQLIELRQLMPHTWFLVPGFGSQGGTAADVAGAFDSRGLGAIVNSSRGIIFAHEREDYAQRFPPDDWRRAVEAATIEAIEQLRAVS
ncbi:MAG: orotidine-5'-phosphate decarboxylase [Pirellulales bacterium]